MKKYSIYEAPLLDPQLPFTARSVFQKKYTQLVFLELSPGQVLPPHTVDFVATFIVLEGSGYCLSNSQKTVIKPHDIIHFEPEEQRGWENTGTKTLKLLVFKEHLE